jgi:site-specific DNA-methyltransferase (adenine-specific)
MIEINKIYNENCLDTMKRMPDNFVDLTVTSPPYDNLRDYKGYIFPFEDIARELYRITKQGGIVVWVVADGTVNGSRTGTSFRQALYFIEIGFNLHQRLFYEKSGPPPDPTRYEETIEEMFVFSKGKPKTINLIRDKKNRWAGVMPFGHRTIREKDGSLSPKPIRVINEYSKRTSVWRYATGHNHSCEDDCAFEHPAIFPELLAGDHIISWSNEGDLVYDPFMGSGTTAKMAHKLKRNWIGSEISKKYVELAEKRIAPYLAQKSLF